MISATREYQKKKPEQSQEAVAKLLCPEKSKILWPFASGSLLTRAIRRGQPRIGLSEENGRKWTQKGDFNGQMSFAIASQVQELGHFDFHELTYPLQV